MDYFSDREHGPLARSKGEVGPAAWGGLCSLIRGIVANGGFGLDFPEECPDDKGIVGTDARAFALALRAEIPDIDWPLPIGTVPETPTIFDLVEFCHRHVADPIERSYHDYFSHSHFQFERVEGQWNFRDSVNRILARNGIAFSLEEDGTVSRVGPPILDEELRQAIFATGDSALDQLLESARSKFLSPDPGSRRDALEKIWDAWERLKTLEVGGDKRASTSALLDKAADEPTYREMLERESRELTDIGNTFHIRHSEATQIEVRREDQVDYLFHRAFALIVFLIRSR